MLDTPSGSVLREVDRPPQPRSITMLTLVHGWPQDARRWLEAVLQHSRGRDYEALLVANGAGADVARWLAEAAADSDRVRQVALDPAVGWAEAANRGLEAATGETVILFDPGVEITGDVAGPLLEALEAPGVVLAGAFGVRSQDRPGHFHDSPGPEVEAVEGYCLAVRRTAALEAGGFDRRFRYYRIADLEFGFRLRDRHPGGRAVVVPGLPLVRHQHRLWEAHPPEERDRLSRRNFYRFLDRWGERRDLLVG